MILLADKRIGYAMPSLTTLALVILSLCAITYVCWQFFSLF